MKFPASLFLAFSLALAAASAGAAPLSPGADTRPAVFTSGNDWTERMTPGEKYLSILAPMAVFYQYGVQFRLRPEEYIPKIDRLLEWNPQLHGEDVTNIFASAVYLFEPENRPAFDSMETEFLRGNFEPLRLTVLPPAEA
jgi:hypothetical protein